MKKRLFSESQYAMMMDEVHDVILKINRKGECMYCNQSWTTVTGFTSAETIGNNLFHLIHPEDLRPLLQLLRKDFRKKIVRSTPIRCLAKSGKILLFHFICAPSFTPKWEAFGCHGDFERFD